MSKTLFKRILGFALLCLAQALVLNRIHLFSFATPLLYVYMVLLFRRNYPHWGVLIWCFFMGLVVDSFSNTPGLATASMTSPPRDSTCMMTEFVEALCATRCARRPATIDENAWCGILLLLYGHLGRSVHAVVLRIGGI